MRRIALINQKGGVGKTTSTVNLGAALAREGRRVVVVDLDPQANLSLHLDVQLRSGDPSSYTVLLGNGTIESALRDTKTPGLRLLASNIDLSGAELELSNAFGREMILRDALEQWEQRWRAEHGEAPADYVLLDCPPSLGLLSVNGLVAAHEAVIVVQTEFFALQGMTKLVDVVQLLRRRLNPKLEVSAILPCLYDNRTKLAREVLGELRAHFPGKVLSRAVAKNVKLAEAPSYGQTIFEYAPESSGASDYRDVARELIAAETRDADLVARYGAPKPAFEPLAAPEPVVTLKPARAPRPKRAAPPDTKTEAQPEASLPSATPAAEEVVVRDAAPVAVAAEPVTVEPAPQKAMPRAAEAEATRPVLASVPSAPAPSPTPAESGPHTGANLGATNGASSPTTSHAKPAASVGVQPLPLSVVLPPPLDLDDLPDLPPDAELLPRYVDL
ncbi:MAG: AAA family ATPase [Planctomycetes bacterium]|nr:AAA family ATPase [Planctomycetota bacterium]